MDILYIYNFISFLHLLSKLAQVPSRLETITLYRNCEKQKSITQYH